MPRALSVDLRERVLDALTSGRSVAEVASQFDVSIRSVYRWSAQRAETGSVRPKQATGRPRKIGLAQEVALRAEVAAHPDATLAELCATLPEPVSPTAMGRALHRMGLRRKKRV